MSKLRVETKYYVEDTYRGQSERTLYAVHNLSTDLVSFYDDAGDLLFIVPDTIDNNIIDAIKRLYEPYDGDELKKDVKPSNFKEHSIFKD